MLCTKELVKSVYKKYHSFFICHFSYKIPNCFCGVFIEVQFHYQCLLRNAIEQTK